MSGLTSLLKKELKEQLRTYRLVIVGGLFVFFGITTPLMLKYLPEILKLAGDQGMSIQIPPPTAAQSLAEYASTLGQVGVLVAVLVSMGCVANELKYGTVVMTLSKPVSRAAFVSAKLIAMSATFIVSLAVASLFCFAYTTWLIEGSSVLAFVGLNLLVALFLVFCLALTLLFSSSFKSSLAAGGLAIFVIISQAGLSVLPLFGKYMPGALLSWGESLLTGGSQSYWLALSITVAVIVLCLYLSQRALRNRDL